MTRGSVRVVFVFFAASALILSCRSKIPVIHFIEPNTGKPGDVLTINGDNFGKERDESYVTIAGAAPTNSSYLEWRNNRILVKLPDFGESGLIYVYVKGGKSNGALFSNQLTLPRPVWGDDTGPEPRIVSVNPLSAPAGSLIRITGNNFGNSREGGGVFFSWSAESRVPAPEDAKTPAFIEVSETEFGYELWTEREIRLRVPDGAVSGNMEIRTPRGNSRPVFFDVTGKTGTKTLRDKRSYTISYSVGIKVNDAKGANTLYLWIPRPAVSASQRNIELVSRNAAPFVENHRGTSLYKLDNLATGGDVRITLAWQVEVYAVETVIRPLSIRQEPDSPALVYTRSSPLIPADDPRIQNQVKALIGREQNPYFKARRIYDWLIGGDIIRETMSGTAGETASALEAKQADPFTAALLYCAMLRAAEVPCLPVAGVLINRNRQVVRHYWTEFWIDGFGWIPVDPVLGAGAIPAFFALRDDRADFYFGGLDNQRIAFSRGQTTLSQMNPRGRTVSHTRSYALQNLWEEAVGDIESYSSLWGDITITGMYVQ